MTPTVFVCRCAGNRTSDIVYYLRYSGDRGDRGPEYNVSAVVRGPAGVRLSRVNCAATASDDDGGGERHCGAGSETAADAGRHPFLELRSRATVVCADRASDPDPNDERYECFEGPCLFDVGRDPCEYRNVAGRYPDVLDMMTDMLEQFGREAVRQHYPAPDPGSDPRNFGGYWDVWMDSAGGTESTSVRHVNTAALLISAALFYRIFF